MAIHTPKTGRKKTAYTTVHSFLSFISIFMLKQVNLSGIFLIYNIVCRALLRL